ncbi:MAG: RluA family pseudouridine synthase [Nitrospinae bacterium]|nr:RluA family pseudouridine synthase [Nitrospinota bacterium]
MPEGINSVTLTVPPDSAGARIDKFIADSPAGLSRSFVQKLLDEGLVSVSGKVAHASTKLKSGDTVAFTIPAPKPAQVLPENIPLDVVYEDDDIIVINKPAGMVAHPAAGHFTGTLVHALLEHCMGNLSGVGGELRPGIVHRLDKDTTGLIVAAKNDRAHQSLTNQLSERAMSRVYVAVVKGSPKQAEGVVEANIGRHPKQRKKMAVLKRGGRPAATKYRVTQNLGKASVVELSLLTGRTHQIRVHMQSINCPVAGDQDYARSGGGYPIKRQALHAWRLKLVHPVSGEHMEFSAPLPEDMTQLIKFLGGNPEPYL